MITKAKYNKCEQNIWPKRLMKGILSKAYWRKRQRKKEPINWDLRDISIKYHAAAAAAAAKSL